MSMRRGQNYLMAVIDLPFAICGNKYVMRYYVILLMLFALACNRGADQSVYNEVDEAAFEYAPLESKGNRVNAESEPINPSNNMKLVRKLIKNGTISFESDDLESTSVLISEAVKKYNAHVSKENEYKSSHRIARNVTLRIPANNFDKLLADISKGVEYFDEKTINVNDVTAEFLDISARLKTKKELETRYIELLSKANKVSEILEIEREIGNLRSDIESIEGRLKYLNDQVGYSTLNISFYQQITKEIRFWSKVKDNLSGGWGLLIFLILGFLRIWPIWILIAVAIWLLRKWRRKQLSK